MPMRMACRDCLWQQGKRQQNLMWWTFSTWTTWMFCQLHHRSSRMSAARIQFYRRSWKEHNMGGHKSALSVWSHSSPNGMSWVSSMGVSCGGYVWWYHINYATRSYMSRMRVTSYREDEGASSELRLVAWNRPRHRITGNEMSRMPESPVWGSHGATSSMGVANETMAAHTCRLCWALHGTHVPNRCGRTQ